MRTQIAITCIGLLIAEITFGQMGGGRGGGNNNGEAPRSRVPNIPRETMIYYLPDEWYAAQPMRDANKMDFFSFPEDQDLEEWTETLRQEAYLTTAGLQSAGRVYELRAESNSESCPNFTSEVLEQEPENGYSTIVWRQSCQPSEELTFSSLHKAILGNDSLYVLSKIWKYDPSNRIWRRWESYFEDIYVCDPVRTEHPCRPIAPDPGNASGGGGRSHCRLG